MLATFPELARHVPRIPLAELPTPVRAVSCERRSGTRRILIKEDNRSARAYGGNKVRKLEYLLARARRRDARLIATFGTVGSHHALATSVYAQQLGFDSIAFLSHQARTADVAPALNRHLELGTELVPFGGSRAERIATLRRHLRGRRAHIIPLGGSSWLGTLGFVNAGLELAQQIRSGDCDRPDRVYVATGTMGTAVGLALGFALAELPLPLHAIRISHPSITNAAGIRHLADKTAQLMHRYDRRIPADLAGRLQLTLRHEFFAGGYAHTDAATERAIDIARNEMNLKLEVTYTGKAMAALLSDLDAPEGNQMTPLFWHSYHGAPLPCGDGLPADTAGLPDEFLRYFS